MSTPRILACTAALVLIIAWRAGSDRDVAQADADAAPIIHRDMPPLVEWTMERYEPGETFSKIVRADDLEARECYR